MKIEGWRATAIGSMALDLTLTKESGRFYCEEENVKTRSCHVNGRSTSVTKSQYGTCG